MVRKQTANNVEACFLMSNVMSRLSYTICDVRKQIHVLDHCGNIMEQYGRLLTSAKIDECYLQTKK